MSRASFGEREEVANFKVDRVMSASSSSLLYSFVAPGMAHIKWCGSRILRPSSRLCRRCGPSDSYSHLSMSSRTCMSSSSSTSSSARPKKHPNIAVVGGGFGGLFTALSLSQMPWSRLQKPQITLIDRNQQFVFLPLLYDLIAGEMDEWQVAPKFNDLLRGTGIRHYHSEFLGFDADKKTLSVEQAATRVIDTMPYDCLVFALGSNSTLSMVPGAQENALPIMSLRDALRIKERAQMLLADTAEAPAPVYVVGGNHSGVEIACTLADMLHPRRIPVKIVFPSEELLSTAREPNRTAAQQRLRELGVQVLSCTKVTEVMSDGVELQGMRGTETMPASIVIWSAGAMPASQPIRDSSSGNFDVEYNGRGQLRVPRTARLTEGVFALGDVAEMTDKFSRKPLKATAQVAMQQAECVAGNVFKELSSAPRNRMPKSNRLREFEYMDLGEMLYLGRRNATLASIAGVSVQGPAAHAARRAAYLARMPTNVQRALVGAAMISDPVFDALDAVQAGADVAKSASSRVRPSWDF
ncbi:Alternative NAD(P)H-ubiquinone oxidoreductase C1, chloroplastic/mitochondrial [Porphyridium purpureum]|uniref:Alternative NAD(P)H-ubiquinone oxidoreductase C1, chloroplastic/mitochondrial n=1 Tax=Porphyridium purpureum TaxID=35688 RepID=A0A5J4Z256_PORPP|nr:Alternative NAD(P)H-ubiquinone oxidoreductase C1, chloroplastic/mitochondrial [Porphyridium purpureum]|eukprot:POR4783..scf208_2